MNKVITIYDAKTNLSKLVKQAQKGKTIYIGAYGQAQAALSPITPKQPIKFGMWSHKALPYKERDIIEPDREVAREFEKNIDEDYRYE